MKPSAQLQTCIELLILTGSEKSPSDALLSAYFRARRFIGSKDRAAIAQRFYNVLRHWARLNWWRGYLAAGESSEKSTNHLIEIKGFSGLSEKSVRALLLSHLRLVEQMETKEVAALFEGGKYAPAPLDDAEKKLLNELKGRTLLHPQMPEAAKLECPAWAYEKLKSALGGDFEKEQQAMLMEASLDLRVNSVKATREQALAELEKADIEAAPTPLSKLGIRVKGRPSIVALDIFKQGWIEIQDEGSQLVAEIVAASPGMSVVDFCAGAGGKTLAIAASMNNKGRVVACDVLGGRLKRAQLRFRRAGLHNISVRELADENDDWVKRNAALFDRVLVDAPCSGTGVWRRNPDARWKNLGPGLDDLTALQARILKSASRLVKPGGRLIYATCSMLNEENQMQVEKFLKENAAFTRAGEEHSLTPARHGTDG
ncbi:MAG TPA: RsmB/NOP family class I SAM-dependent RNA methyltransferase, partial [Alphaproteobacteria bacterium]|nr:RsmB/NOP family class I SAM-dependent RNA methyltransferase [Alphaproteobacteria bacterium]